MFPLAAGDADVWYCEEAGDDCGMVAACEDFSLGEFLCWIAPGNTRKSPQPGTPPCVPSSLLAKGVNLALSLLQA